MLVLGIDTSTSVASVALMNETQLIAEMTLNDKKTHSQKLMLLIDQMMQMNDLTMTMLDRIVVGIGPGSFTGLRIGVTTAKGLAHGANLELVEVSSLKSLANNICSPYPVCAMMDARRDTVFTGIFGDVVLAETQIHIDELLETCKNITKVVFVGDGATKHKEKIVEILGEQAIFAPMHLNQISASSLCEIGISSNVSKKYDDVHVTYLRKSQAEREYDERKK